jgi:hypothetical protein
MEAPPNTFTKVIPSTGQEITMQYLNLYQLLINGEIPDPITGLVENMIMQTLIARGVATIEERDSVKRWQESTQGEGAEEAEDRARQLLRLIVRRASVNPIISFSLDEVRALKASGQAVLFFGELTRQDLYAIYFASLGVGEELLEVFNTPKSAPDIVPVVSDMSGDGDQRSGSPGDTNEPALDALHAEPGDTTVGGVCGLQPERKNRRAAAPTVDNPRAHARSKGSRSRPARRPGD